MNNRVTEQTELGWDIETIPNKCMIEMLPETELKLGNVKDPIKIAAKKEIAKKEQIDKMALNPFFGRICSSAFYGNNGNISLCKVIDKITDYEEVKLIEWTFQMFSNTRIGTPTIITWNGEVFDLRFLYTRAAILNVRIPTGFITYETMGKKFNNNNHIDLMKVLCSYGKFEKLDTAALVFLGEQKLDHDFTKFIELIEAGHGDEIGKYNLHDSRLTYEIYQKAKKYFLNNY